MPNLNRAARWAADVAVGPEAQRTVALASLGFARIKLREFGFDSAAQDCATLEDLLHDKIRLRARAEEDEARKRRR